MNHSIRCGAVPRVAPALLVILACASAGCNRHKIEERTTIEDTAAPSLSSTIHMGDPRAASQLIEGFHSIENGAWRWTMKQFSVSLHPPTGSRQRGAVVALSFSVPPVVIEKLQSVSLAASVAGTNLPAEVYAKSGDYVYKGDIPAALLSADPVRVDFHLDKAMPPSDKDLRELGIVVSKVSLELK